MDLWRLWTHLCVSGWLGVKDKAANATCILLTQSLVGWNNSWVSYSVLVSWCEDCLWSLHLLQPSPTHTIRVHLPGTSFLTQVTSCTKVFPSCLHGKVRVVLPRLFTSKYTNTISYHPYIFHPYLLLLDSTVMECLIEIGAITDTHTQEQNPAGTLGCKLICVYMLLSTYSMPPCVVHQTHEVYSNCAFTDKKRSINNACATMYVCSDSTSLVTREV